jgi:hypothetical protein
MPKITECVITVELANAIRSVALALKVKVPKGKLGFRCPECRQPVKPMISADGKQSAHFEHLQRNSGCGLSYVRRIRKDQHSRVLAESPLEPIEK